MEREMYLYECQDCVLTFGVETAYEDHSDVVCPVCQSDENVRDAGCWMGTMTREPEVVEV